MARDYTKYTVKSLGENLNKRQLVFQIVKDYVEKNKPSFDELTAVFKDEIQGSKGFIRKAAKVEDPKRFNTKMPLKIKFGVEVVVSNQWGSDNTQRFIDYASNLGYSIEKVEAKKSNISKSSADNISIDLELREDNQSLICSIKNFKINTQGNNKEINEMYEALLENFDDAECSSLIYKIIDNFEREIYHEFLTNSHASGIEYGFTIDDVKQEHFDWWEVCPHLVVSRIGNIDLNPIVNLDEDDEDMFNKCCEMMNIGDEDRDYWEDYISDYFVNTRFSVVDDLFKEVNEEL